VRAAAVTSAASFGSAWKKARARKTAAAKKPGVTRSKGRGRSTLDSRNHYRNAARSHEINTANPTPTAAPNNTAL